MPSCSRMWSYKIGRYCWWKLIRRYYTYEGCTPEKKAQYTEKSGVAANWLLHQEVRQFYSEHYNRDVQVHNSLIWKLNHKKDKFANLQKFQPSKRSSYTVDYCNIIVIDMRTVNVERFGRLNFCWFNPMKFSFTVSLHNTYSYKPCICIARI